jgi:hypothetical protein
MTDTREWKPRAPTHPKTKGSWDQYQERAAQIRQRPGIRVGGDS